MARQFPALSAREGLVKKIKPLPRAERGELASHVFGLPAERIAEQRGGSSSRLWPVATTSKPRSRATRLKVYRFDSPHTEQVDRDPFVPAEGMSKPYSSRRSLWRRSAPRSSANRRAASPERSE